MTSRCIFCDGRPLTREHVFPRWLDGVLPEQQEWRGQDRVRVFRPGRAQESRLVIPTRHVGKRLTDTQVKVVCQACNGGWMNDLEQRARPWLTPMIQGRKCWISTDAAVSVATWAVKTALMAEFTDVGSQANHAEQHRALYRDKVPSSGTRVWAGRLSDTEDWGVRLQHQGCLYGADLDIELPCNTHQTTLGLNHLLLAVVGSSAERFPALPLEEIAPLVRLWPPEPGIKWPPSIVIGDEGAWLISTAMEAWIRGQLPEVPQSAGGHSVARASAAPADDLYHACHTCGHFVYWSDSVFALSARNYPCPWCGGEFGSHPPPQDANVLVDSKIGLLGYRDPRVGSAPGDSGWVTIHHMADDSCCRGSAAARVQPGATP